MNFLPLISKRKCSQLFIGSRLFCTYILPQYDVSCCGCPALPAPLPLISGGRCVCEVGEWAASQVQQTHLTVPGGDQQEHGGREVCVCAG